MASTVVIGSSNCRRAAEMYGDAAKARYINLSNPSDLRVELEKKRISAELKNKITKEVDVVSFGFFTNFIYQDHEENKRANKALEKPSVGFIGHLTPELVWLTKQVLMTAHQAGGQIKRIVCIAPMPRHCGINEFHLQSNYLDYTMYYIVQEVIEQIKNDQDVQNIYWSQYISIIEIPIYYLERLFALKTKKQTNCLRTKMVNVYPLLIKYGFEKDLKHYSYSSKEMLSAILFNILPRFCEVPNYKRFGQEQILREILGTFFVPEVVPDQEVLDHINEVTARLEVIKSTGIKIPKSFPREELNKMMSESFQEMIQGEFSQKPHKMAKFFLIREEEEETKYNSGLGINYWSNIFYKEYGKVIVGFHSKVKDRIDSLPSIEEERMEENSEGLGEEDEKMEEGEREQGEKEKARKGEGADKRTEERKENDEPTISQLFQFMQKMQGQVSQIQQGQQNLQAQQAQNFSPIQQNNGQMVEPAPFANNHQNIAPFSTPLEYQNYSYTDNGNNNYSNGQSSGNNIIPNENLQEQNVYVHHVQSPMQGVSITPETSVIHNNDNEIDQLVNDISAAPFTQPHSNTSLDQNFEEMEKNKEISKNQEDDDPKFLTAIVSVEPVKPSQEYQNEMKKQREKHKNKQIKAITNGTLLEDLSGDEDQNSISNGSGTRSNSRSSSNSRSKDTKGIKKNSK